MDKTECICIYCSNNLREIVNSLSQAFSLESIVSQMATDHGITGNTYILKKHYKALSIPYNEQNATSISRVIPLQRTAEDGLSNYHEAVNLRTDLSLDRWGLSMDNPQAIVTFIQEKLLALGLQQMEVVAGQQKMYTSGDSPLEPTREAINNLRILFSLFDKFAAVGLFANQQQAVRIVQAMGIDTEALSDTAASNKPVINSEQSNNDVYVNNENTGVID